MFKPPHHRPPQRQILGAPERTSTFKKKHVCVRLIIECCSERKTNFGKGVTKALERLDL